jgi:hypothetical protein
MTNRIGPKPGELLSARISGGVNNDFQETWVALLKYRANTSACMVTIPWYICDQSYSCYQTLSKLTRWARSNIGLTDSDRSGFDLGYKKIMITLGVHNSTPAPVKSNSR